MNQPYPQQPYAQQPYAQQPQQPYAQQPYPQQPFAQPQSKSSPAASFFAIVAIFAGLAAFFTAGMRGHSAGWEMMAMYTTPSVVAAIIALGIRRNALTWVGLVFAVISVGSFFLGA
jgi:hypothetical protein